MKIEVHQASSNPSNSDVLIYEGSDLVCRIDDGDFRSEVLTEAQAKRYENGEYKFDVPKNKLYEHCSKWFLIGR